MSQSQFKNLLKCSLPLWVVAGFIPKMTARDLANTLSLSYMYLGLTHLNALAGKKH